MRFRDGLLATVVVKGGEMLSKVIFTVLFLFSASQFALAHDAWIAERDGALIVLYGHGHKLDPYDPASVKDAKGFGAKGESVAVEVLSAKDKASLAPKGTPAIVVALFDGGYGVKTADGWKKTTKREAKGKYDVVEALRSEKYTKAFLAPSEAWSKTVGHRLEIVPQKDPMTIRPGETLPIKVLLDGKPHEGVEVTAISGHDSDKKDPIKTDRQGMAKVPIGQSGPQMVKAGCKTPIKNDPDADVLYLSSTITFGTH
jgi:nickel transport protein